MAVTDLKVITY